MPKWHVFVKTPKIVGIFSIVIIQFSYPEVNSIFYPLVVQF